jgi:hypothetical protein
LLPRQPLRFLLADDPGAGKTIMAGLLVKELIARGDLQRCLIVCPGSLAERWQDELYRRFHLPFEILTNDKLEAARSGNWFLENNLVIARLDKLSRNEDVQEKLQAPDARWDLIVCDEAHKMSASFFGGELKYTKRYRLGQLLSTLTRHFLLMTATPHNGKEEDFQLFMALLDGDRFEGRFRDGVHVADVSDLMRRMVKENLLTFDGTPMFPERIARTVPYRLSEPEAQLHTAVSDYVRDEFNRAEALQNDKRAGNVGFALTILQRRLASSPEAIYQSLRRDRLESRLRELEVLQRGGQVAPILAASLPALDAEDVEDLDDAPDDEVAAAEEAFLDRATAARSIAELKMEIDTLKRLESLALSVRPSGADTKWRELANLLGEIFTPAAIRGVAEESVPYEDQLRGQTLGQVGHYPVASGPCPRYTTARRKEPGGFAVIRFRLASPGASHSSGLSPLGKRSRLMNPRAIRPSCAYRPSRCPCLPAQFGLAVAIAGVRSTLAAAVRPSDHAERSWHMAEVIGRQQRRSRCNRFRKRCPAPDAPDAACSGHGVGAAQEFGCAPPLRSRRPETGDCRLRPARRRKLAPRPPFALMRHSDHLGDDKRRLGVARRR